MTTKVAFVLKLVLVSDVIHTVKIFSWVYPVLRLFFKSDVTHNKSKVTIRGAEESDVSLRRKAFLLYEVTTDKLDSLLQILLCNETIKIYIYFFNVTPVLLKNTDMHRFLNHLQIWILLLWKELQSSSGIYYFSNHSLSDIKLHNS